MPKVSATSGPSNADDPDTTVVVPESSEIEVTAVVAAATADTVTNTVSATTRTVPPTVMSTKENPPVVSSALRIECDATVTKGAKP